MNSARITVLDGTRRGDGDLGTVLGILTEELERCSHRIQVLTLRDMRIEPCTGCNACWSKRPGLCVMRDDAEQVIEASIRSGTLVLFTPIIFGGVSYELKKALDRRNPTELPFAEQMYGELHHPPRYGSGPRYLMVGVQREVDIQSKQLFLDLADRSSGNLHGRVEALVVNTSDDPRLLRRQLRAAVDGVQMSPESRPQAAFPAGRVFPGAALAENETTLPRPRHALLLIGSPKVHHSTSGVLGTELLSRLAASGIQTEALHINTILQRKDAQSKLLDAVDRADLVIFSFPLYVDSLPAPMIKAMEMMSAARQGKPSQRFAAIVNSGFPEPWQSTVALATCRQFARQTGLVWSGGLVLPAGGALDGHALQTGLTLDRPPIYHIPKALNLAATALSHGQAIPLKAIQVMASSPIPGLPQSLWFQMYRFMMNASWRKKIRGARMPVDPCARPYWDLQS